jgi:CheY-like chemotaxis protein
VDQSVLQYARFQQLPIIAMTAHALQDERERCLAEGMNDHIAKPIDPQLFYKLLSHYLVHKLSGSRQNASNNSHLQLQLDGLDSQTALQRVNGNQTLYLQLLQQFCHEQGGIPARIRDLLAQQQPTIGTQSERGGRQYWRHRGIRSGRTAGKSAESFL